MRWTLLTLLLIVCAVNVALAQDDAGIAFYEKKIRPVLLEHCGKCHTGKKLRADFSVESREAMLAGGGSGPGIVPGKPDQSLLIKAVRHADEKLKMPKEGKLPANIIADLEKWVAMGAPAPAGKASGGKKAGLDIEAGRKFWAYQPVKKQPPPKVKNAAWAHGPIDQFLLAKMEEKGVQPVKDADKVTLLRRAYFALIGMPPTSKQIDDFVNDKSPEALANVVDKLLASPQFGERWGRHWLDLARFSESTGGGRSLLLPDAWRYRDYVIHSINVDKPYHLFIKEQIAGDLLPFKTTDERTWQLAATAFLLLGPTNYEMQDKPTLEWDVIDEQIDTMGRAFLGMTIGCARCHDHKFDPIPTADYYALAGIFKSTKTLIHDNVSMWTTQPLPAPPEQEAIIAKHDAKIAVIKTQIAQLKSDLKKAGISYAATMAQGVVDPKDLPGMIIDDTQAKKIGNWTVSKFQNTYIGNGYLYSGKGNNTLTFSPQITKHGMYEVRFAYLAHANRATNTEIHILHSDGETTVRVDQKKVPPIDGRWISLGKYRFEKGDQWYVMVMTKDCNGSVVADAVQFLSEDDLKVQPPAPKAADNKPAAGATKLAPEVELKKLEAALKKLQADAPKKPSTMAPVEASKIGDTYICVRGVHTNKGPAVKRGMLQVATVGPMPAIPAGQSGRLQLAEWLASDKNPLTARVKVNRLWHHLFGAGIVKSVDNIGTTGDLPSHPELLDYLALRLMEQGWSVKKVIREIVLSHAWQLSSQVDAADPAVQQALKADVDNRLLWKQNRQRLEAECLRDAILMISGKLDLTVGGPNIAPGTTIERDYKFLDTRRSVYTPVFRNHLHELFSVFDFPDPNLVAGKRAASTVAPQALYLMNSPFVMEQAKFAAKTLLAQPGLTDAQRIAEAYRAALGRTPSMQESALALGFLQQAGGNGTATQREAAYAQFVQVLFASMDFRYVN